MPVLGGSEIFGGGGGGTKVMTYEIEHGERYHWMQNRDTPNDYFTMDGVSISSIIGSILLCNTLLRKLVKSFNLVALGLFWFFVPIMLQSYSYYTISMEPICGLLHESIELLSVLSVQLLSFPLPLANKADLIP